MGELQEIRRPSPSFRNLPMVAGLSPHFCPVLSVTLPEHVDHRGSTKKTSDGSILFVRFQWIQSVTLWNALIFQTEAMHDHDRVRGQSESQTIQSTVQICCIHALVASVPSGLC